MAIEIAPPTKASDDDEELRGCLEGCCKRDNDNDGGPRCMCLPYNDALLITAQSLSVLAFVVSCFWWVSAFLGFVAMILLQLAWCSRQPTKVLVASQILAVGACLAALAAGIDAVTVLFYSNRCHVLLLDHRGYRWNCRDVVVVFFVDFVLWAATAGCSIAFLCTGNHAKWENHYTEQHSNGNHHQNKNNHNHNQTTAHHQSTSDNEEETAPKPFEPPLSEKKPVEEDEETAITTTTTINDGAFAPREMMEQMVDDDDDDDEASIDLVAAEDSNE